MEAEHWKPVVGFEDRYEVSSWGNVRSLPRMVRQIGNHGVEFERRMGGKPMTTHLMKGYPRLSLRDESGKCHLRNVHRLVAGAFLGPPPFEDAMVAHNDGSRDNNHVTNLRWATAQENSDDRKIHGTDMPGEKNPRAILTNEDALEIRRRYVERYGSQTELAEEFGVSSQVIRHVVRYQTFKHI